MSDTNAENNLGWIDVLGPQIKPVTASTGDQSDYAILLGILGPNVVVPLHSHPDRETFYVLEGAVEGYSAGKWHQLGAGDAFDVAPNKAHAWRNVSARQAKMLIVTTNKMSAFFQEIGKPAGPKEPPTPDEVALFLSTAEAYGYTIAQPSENEAIGIHLS
ncbi:quercetin dioxygenase-like cupin family protein [Rhizobium leguminosarum]|uniref:Quercetin dioxygenase-like cupin family protein n=1 Tax=Rhizobium leguminosarum TaxID=384 RepID=A0AAE2ML46_RHILE|nr:MULTISPECIES: cupin domain-containing protein [Rhizobium]MBB4291481.1 quercetin dioxygenase-like cupin family protein [Rhizobium leguminosarum]MBB4296178.1 quercetin dioxygenase-like cupin family protein [Rhizobium leguminosarum]MBB4308563.1 quercetin dioxygenase-like cupin family protein [Rhizobium leguminosarum]MBB4416398.1 quercetin dioxygenase-like cupin family protein [Rhizobium leguminosarum]MBB4430635.1 quercetin dioxygenase-like cupin family protein [Rhizobium esperanzae]